MSVQFYDGTVPNLASDTMDSLFVPTEFNIFQNAQASGSDSIENMPSDNISAFSELHIILLRNLCWLVLICSQGVLMDSFL